MRPNISATIALGMLTVLHIATVLAIAEQHQVRGALPHAQPSRIPMLSNH
jgi:hypothetical protein